MLRQKTQQIITTNIHFEVTERMFLCHNMTRNRIAASAFRINGFVQFRKGFFVENKDIDFIRLPL